MFEKTGSAHKFRTLEINFVPYVARSFCETIKLPYEMPKVAKCLKCLKLRYPIDLNRKDRAKRYNKSSIFNLQFSTSGGSGMGFPIPHLKG
jgi:hypothetical protein